MGASILVESEITNRCKIKHQVATGDLEKKEADEEA